MKIVEEVGTLVEPNPCSKLIWGFIKQAKVKQGFNRDHYIGSEKSTNDRNFLHGSSLCRNQQPKINSIMEVSDLGDYKSRHTSIIYKIVEFIKYGYSFIRNAD